MSNEELEKMDEDLRFLEDNFINDNMTSITVDIQLIKDFRKLLDTVYKQKEEIEYYKDELELETSSWKKLEKAENLISKDKIIAKIDEYRQLRKYIIKSSKDLEQLIKNIPDFERIDFCIGMLEDLLEDNGEDENGK